MLCRQRRCSPVVSPLNPAEIMRHGRGFPERGKPVAGVSCGPCALAKWSVTCFWFRNGRDTMVTWVVKCVAPQGKQWGIRHAPQTQTSEQGNHENSDHRRRWLHWQPHPADPAAERHEALVYDNFNSKPEALKRVKQLANADFDIREGIGDPAVLEEAFATFRPEAVIHCRFEAVGGPTKSRWSTMLRMCPRLSCSKRCSATIAGIGVFVLGAALWRGDIPALRRSAPAPACQSLWPYQAVREEIIRDWTASSGGKHGPLAVFQSRWRDEFGRIGENRSAYPTILCPISQGRRGG